MTFHHTDIALPAEVIFREILTRSVEFTWGEVFINFIQYVYQITPLQGESIGIVQPGNVRIGSFSSLVPGRQYNVTVTAGTQSDTKSFRTIPLAPSDVFATALGATPTTVRFSWNQPLDPTSEFDSYRITHNIGDGPILGEVFVSRLVDQYVLEDLFPATEYNIYVATSSGTGLLRTISEPATAVASTFTPEAGVIVVLSVTTDTITISWGAADAVAGFTSYAVAIDSPSANRVIDAVQRRATFSNLTPGALFNISVTVLTDTGIQTPQKNIFTNVAQTKIPDKCTFCITVGMMS